MLDPAVVIDLLRVLRNPRAQCSTTFGGHSRSQQGSIQGGLYKSCNIAMHACMHADWERSIG